MRTTINIILIIILLSLLIFTPTSLIALAISNTTDIDVNVSAFSQITLYPNYLSWTNVIAGTAGGEKNITIKNTGSMNVTSIYGWVNTLEVETVRPYGSSNSSNYSAGGVLALRNETGDHFYLGRIEWNWTQDIPNHDWSNINPNPAVAWGYLRNMSDEYVWVLGNGTVNCSDGTAKFSYDPDVDLGTAPTRTPNDTFTLLTAINNANWSYAKINEGPWYGHCVSAYYDCKKVFIYKYDKRTNFSDCGEYLYNAQLAPGNTYILGVDAWVPRGIPAGNLTRTTLTIEATT